MSRQPGDSQSRPEVVFRVVYLPEQLRVAFQERRRTLGQTLRDFMCDVLETELPALVKAVRECLPVQAGDLRPMRLPLSQPLLAALKEAGEAAGLPATRLLLACLDRATRRKRRPRRVASGPTVRGRRRTAGDRKPAPGTDQPTAEVVAAPG